MCLNWVLGCSPVFCESYLNKNNLLLNGKMGRIVSFDGWGKWCKRKHNAKSVNSKKKQEQMDILAKIRNKTDRCFSIFQYYLSAKFSKIIFFNNMWMWIRTRAVLQCFCSPVDGAKSSSPKCPVMLNILNIHTLPDYIYIDPMSSDKWLCLMCLLDRYRYKKICFHIKESVYFPKASPKHPDMMWNKTS